MRILHTGDWHLGHTLREHTRAAEHAVFLDWLVSTCGERQVDALLIAGDVFETANPPPYAQRLWFDFLGQLKRACPRIQVVVIAGNHDGSSRLCAPAELLAALDVRIVGTLQRTASGRPLVEPLLIPLRDRDGVVAALCVAIPFLRSIDVVAALPAVPVAAVDGELLLPRPGELPGGKADAADPVLAGMRLLHDELFAAARAQLRPGQALVAMAHGYLVGGALSELSERKVLGGNQHALPLDLFPDDCAYVALGHLHRPQALAGREHVRYCGSPLPLAMPERGYRHQVAFADLAAGRLLKTWVKNTPRPVPLLRLPEHGELDPEAALLQCAALPPRDPAQPEELRPLLEVAVRLRQPAPGIGERIAAALADKAARLVHIDVVRAGSGAPLAGAEPGPALARLSPEQVFVRRYQKDHDGAPTPELLAAFRELHEQVEHEAGR